MGHGTEELPSPKNHQTKNHELSNFREGSQWVAYNGEK